MELAPAVTGLLPLLGSLLPDQARQLHVLAAKADGFLRSKAAVVEDTEEGNQLRATGPLRSHGSQQGSRPSRIDDNATVDLMRHLGERHPAGVSVLAQLVRHQSYGWAMAYSHREDSLLVIRGGAQDRLV
jgi:hypothetical protein